MKPIACTCDPAKPKVELANGSMHRDCHRPHPAALCACDACFEARGGAIRVERLTKNPS